MRISIHIATYSVRPAHALPGSPHGIHGLVGSADRELVSRSGEWGVWCNVHFFCASPHGMPMGGCGDPQKNGGWCTRSRGTSGVPLGGIWALQVPPRVGRAAPSAPECVPFRVSGFGGRKRRYHAAWHTGRAHPGCWGLSLAPPGRSSGRTGVASPHREAPGIIPQKDH